MALKTKEQLKAEKLRELEEEERKLQEAEAKKQQAAAETARKNKEEDLIGAKDAEKLNSKKETSGGSTFGKGQPAETTEPKKNLGTSKQAASDTIAKAAGAQSGIDKIENAKTEKAAKQARANKEADLPGFDGHEAQKNYEQRVEQERIEYLNVKEARDKKSALEQELAELKAQGKDQGKKAGTAAVVASGLRGRSGSVVDPETQKRISELEKEINELNKNINLASGVQNKKYLYNSALEAEDFDEFSVEPEKENRIINPHQQNVERETETVKKFMTEDERAIYNYYYNKYGEEKAEEFFDSIREDLNKRQAEAIFEGNEGKVFNEYLQGAVAGLENSKEGYKSAINMLLGIDEPQPTGTYDYVAQMAREDLSKTGPKLPEQLGGASLGQIGFDAVNTTANMLPSMALGTIGGPAVGAAAIGASSAGNAYNEALKAGYGKDQAANYAALVGASEAGLGYVLGGISATGGKASKAAISKVVPKIDNALAKAAVNVGGKMASEYSEEYLQEVLTPVFRNIALMEDNEIELLSEDAIYSGILGALSAGGIAVFDGGANVETPQNIINTFEKAEVPVPFNGKAQPGTDAELVANKITEIENRPISEAEKAAKMEEVIQAVAGTTGTAEVIAEAEKFKNYHTKRQAEFDEAVEIGKNLGVSVEFDPNIAGNGIHTSDGRIIINPNTKNPALQVFVHELTHDIETSGLYGAFSEKILGHIKELGYDVNKIREQVKADYEAAGHNLTDSQLDAEVVAKYCEQHLFTDEKAIQRLCDTEPTIFQRIKNWISDIIVKFRGSPEERFLLEAKRLYEKALATRGERPGAGIEQYNISSRMTVPEIQTIQNIGKISVNSFTSQDIKNTERFAKTYWYEMGAKSPFFRAWFGDWRANDQTPVQIANQQGNATGTIKNDDTGWNIQVSSKVFNETNHKGLKNQAALPYLRNIDDITKKAVLLDSFGMEPNKLKSPNSLLMHSMYAVSDIGNGPVVLKLYVEEMYDPNKPETTKRDYQLQNIEIGNLKVQGSHNSVSPIIQTANINTVSDLVTVVKGYDPDFQPKPPSKIVDEDGKPLIVYHGTDADFTVFDRTKSRANMDIQGNFFSPWEDDARGYGSKVGAYYLNIKNPADEATAYRALRKFQGQNEAGAKARDYLVSLGYDGVNNNNEEFIAFYPEQVKSATDNIGTFDLQNPDYRYSIGRSFNEMAAEAKTASMERANKNLGAEDWKKIAEGIAPEFPAIWRMKDFARALDSASDGNKVLRQQLYELYEKPLNEAQGTYANNYSEKVKNIAEKFKELGIKAESKESAAVQRVGEGVKEIDKHGNTVPYTLNDLKKDFPNSWENIKEGADYCRKIYDEFLHDLNAMYSEIYPATVEQANEKVSNYNDRIKNDAEYIDRYNEVIDNLENRRAEKQAELSKKRPDSLVYAEIKNQIANIDYKIEIANKRIERIKNRKLTKEISRDTLKAQIENGEILRNKQIKPRKDYFRHFQELTDEFAEIADIFSNDQRIPPNLAGKSETTKPRTIWTSIAQSRKNGNYYTEDAVSGLLKYTEIAEKLLVFDPLISHFRDTNSAIRAAGTMVENEVKGKGTNAGQFASWADDMTNQLAGKTNIIDRVIADKTGALGRATIKAVEALNRRVKSNAILGNFRSALVQVGNLPNAMLYIQNPIDWTVGAVSLTNPTEEIIDARRQSNFMSRRYMGDSIDALTKEIQQNNILDKPKEFALWMLGAGDKAAAELIWHTAYSRAVRNPEVLSSEKGSRNYDNAIDYADDITRRSIGGRAEGDIPYFEESKITGLVAPFQIEVANTFNALTEQAKKKNVAGIVAFEAGVWLINTVLEGITGDRPLGFDYIDAVLDIVKEATGEEDEEEKDIWELVTFGLGRLAGETISGMPFGAQIGRAITGGDEQKAEDWFGDSDPSRYGTGNIGIGALADAADYFFKGETPEDFYKLITDGKKNSYAEWSKPVLDTVDTFAPLLMPWGGKQLSRSLGGVDQLIRGGAYGEDSNGNEYLKFPQEYDPESLAKTILFGQYASDRGQNYIDSGFKDKLSVKQTEQMKLAEEYGISKDEFYDIVLDLKKYSKKEEKQEALFENPNFSTEEKDALDYILFGGANYKAAENGYVEPERDYSSEEGFYRSGSSETENRLLDAGYSREEVAAIEKAIKNGNTKAEDIAGIMEALGCTETEAFEIYQKRKGDWTNDFGSLSEDEQKRANTAFEYYGMSTEDYLTIYNYTNFGTIVTDANGEEKYSTAKKDVVPNIAKKLNVTEARAEELYDRVNGYDYSRADIDTEETGRLNKAAVMYGVDDKGYFVAKNAIYAAEGEKDKFGNTISGSKKEAAIDDISRQLGISKDEATIYYLAAKGGDQGLVLSVDDLSTSHREDLEEAKKHGWTERQYLDAVNIVKVSGADKKDDIIKALTDAGASYEQAQGYYNLRENMDYNRAVSTGTKGFSYGMKNQKQVDKANYFLEHYNSDGTITEKDLARWYAAASGCSKKQEYIDAYMSAGATKQQALQFYRLMSGHDDGFNAWYKENGG